MSTTTTVAGAAQQELAGFEGQLVGPADADYDEARKVYNAMIDRRPALIARCLGPADVAKAIGFARAHDLLVAIRGGGHNGAGLGTCDAGLVVDLSLLKEIQVDPEARTARVGGGCTWGEVDRATHELGLATPSGIISTTGVGGLTLGGGHGYLTRKHGLTIDNLVAVDLVLADGSFATASEEVNDDLFWAVRGGGGNFGVVTSFTFRLHPVTMVVGGPTLWPIDGAADVLRWYREFQPAAPEDVYGFFALMTVPPAPQFPEHLHLQKACAVVWCYTGPTERAAAALAAVNEPATPVLHGPHELPYPVLQSAFDELLPPGLNWYWRGDFVAEIPESAIERHLEFAATMPTPLSAMHLYPVDAAVGRVRPGDTAFGYRDATWSMVIGGIDPDPANAETIRSWSTDYWQAIHPYSMGGAYVNFMMDEGGERIRATYRDNYDRLAQLKARYDPENVFRVNQNIEPARS